MPSCHMPQEGVLDPTGRKLIATNHATILTGVAVLAVAGLFHF